MIACVGYIFGSSRITVSYDTMNKKFIVEEYRDKDTGIKMYSLKSREEVKESLDRFKSFNNKQ